MMGEMTVSSFLRPGEPTEWHYARIGQIPPTRSHDGRLVSICDEDLVGTSLTGVPGDGNVADDANVRAGEILIQPWQLGFVVYEVASAQPATPNTEPRLWLRVVYPHRNAKNDRPVPMGVSNLLCRVVTDPPGALLPGVDNPVDNPVEKVGKTTPARGKKRSGVDK